MASPLGGRLLLLGGELLLGRLHGVIIGVVATLAAVQTSYRRPRVTGPRYAPVAAAPAVLYALAGADVGAEKRRKKSNRWE
jgi:hypothetical protein